jgi:invasion protein IalB
MQKETCFNKKIQTNLKWKRKLSSKYLREKNKFKEHKLVVHVPSATIKSALFEHGDDINTFRAFNPS